MSGFCLLDYLSWKLGLLYLSDLRTLPEDGRSRLRHILKERIELKDFPEAEWLDACEYITGRRAESAAEARVCLLGQFVREGGFEDEICKP